MTPALLDADAVTVVVGEVFAGLFGEDDGRPYPDDHRARLPVVAAVRIGGSCDRVVTVRLGHVLVTVLAARLFRIPTAEVTDTHRHDIAGELANIVGGNVKSMLPGPSTLSLPTVRLDAPVSAVGASDGLTVDLVWRRLPLRVTLTAPTPWKEQS